MRICIVGYGGFGKEVAEYIRQDLKEEICIFDDFVTSCPSDFCFMGKIDDYKINSSDRFIIAFGDPLRRFQETEKLKTRNAIFTSFVHSSVYFASSAKIGLGTIICPNCVVNAEASIGESCVINVGTSVGHETSVGDFSVLSSYSVINGKSKVGRGCFLATRVTLFPKAILGDFSVVDSHCCVKGNVEKNNIVSSRVQYSNIKNRLSKEF